MKKVKAIAPCMLLACSLLAICGCNNTTSNSSAASSAVATSSVASSEAASSSEASQVSSTTSRNTVDAAWQIPESGFDTTQDVNIVFYNTMGNTLTPILDEYIASFQAEYPNIHITYTSGVSYSDLLSTCTTELSVGEGPDLAYCYPDHVALYNKTKNVITLDNLIYDDELGLTEAQYNDYVSGYYEEGQTYGDGLMYSLPFSKSTEILYYNKTIFDKLKLSTPDHWFSTSSADTTSMEYVCAALKTAYPDSTPLGYDSSDNLFINMCEQYGSPYTSATGEHFVFNNDTNKAFVKEFKEKLYDKGYMTTQAIYGSYTSGLFCNWTSANESGKDSSFMSIGSSAGASHQVPTKGSDGNYPFEVAVAEIPQVNQDNKKVISQGPDVCLFNHGDSQKIIASWLFTKYLTTSVEFQAEFSMSSGYIPVIKSVKENETYKAFLESANSATADLKDRTVAASANLCVEQESAYFTSPTFVGSSTARTQVGNLITQYFTGDKTLDEAFASAIATCEASI